MDGEKTRRFLNELKDCERIESFIETHEPGFSTLTCPAFLKQKMDERGVKKAQLVRDAGFSEVYVYQILAGAKHPERDKLLCLALALKLSPDEADQLLRTEGKSHLYARNRRDAAVFFALREKLSVAQTNDLLYDLGERTLSGAV